MLRKEYPYEVRCQAEDLYVDDGFTYEEVAERLGVALNTIKNWAKKGAWRERRENKFEARRTYREKMSKLRQAMMDKVLEDMDPQNVYALIRLERLALDKEKKPDGGGSPEIDRPKAFLEDMEFIATVLQEVDPAGMKIFARNFEIIVQRFKEREAA